MGRDSRDSCMAAVLFWFRYCWLGGLWQVNFSVPSLLLSNGGDTNLPQDCGEASRAPGLEQAACTEL